MDVAQSESLAENRVVREYLKLLTEIRQEAGREYAVLLRQLDGVQRQLDVALRELAQVREELAKMQECPEKGVLTHGMEVAGKQASTMQGRLSEMKKWVISSAREAVESVKKSGIKALDKLVSVVGIRKGLEEMHRDLAGSIQEVSKSIERVETVGRELRSVGGHLKNAGRAAIGREQQEVDGGTEGRFQAAILAPMRREKSILDRINNLVLAALGSVERLEREAGKAREEKREDRGEADKSDKAGGTDRDIHLQDGKMSRPGGGKGTDRSQTARPGEGRGPDKRQADCPGGAGELARAGNEPAKPSVLKDIQEKKRETVSHPAPAPGKNLKTREVAL